MKPVELTFNETEQQSLGLEKVIKYLPENGLELKIPNYLQKKSEVVTVTVKKGDGIEEQYTVPPAREEEAPAMHMQVSTGGTPLINEKLVIQMKAKN